MHFDNIHYLGNFGKPEIISIYFIDDAEPTLIDPGPSCVTVDLLDALKDRVKEISYIVITHLHLDHSGGAWALLKHMPKVRVLIDSNAAKYIIDPSRLLESARQVLGDIVDQWGDMKPIDPSKIIGVKENDILNIGRSRLRFIQTPGHAPFHLSVIDERSASIFTGDAVGIRIDNVLWPASTLPSFRLDLALQSMKNIKSLKPKRLMTPHFGISEDAEKAIEENVRVYERWGEIIEEAFKKDLDINATLSAIKREFGYDGILKDRYNYTLFMTDLYGYLEYFKKKSIKETLKGDK